MVYFYLRVTLPIMDLDHVNCREVFLLIVVQGFAKLYFRFN